MEDATPENIDKTNMDVDEQEPEPSTSPASLQGWSKEDKFELLEALRACASDDIDQLQEYLPNKTPNEIQKAISYYNEKALKLLPKADNMEKPRENKSKCSPLAQWAELLTDNFSFAELNTDIATAIRLIANYEHIPASVSTENIDFRKIYHVIANAIEGKPLPQDSSIIDIINKCLIETAMTSKAFIKTSTLKSIISKVDVTSKESYIFPKPTAESEVSCIKYLGSQIAYNPLYLSEDLLKVTRDNSNKKD